MPRAALEQVARSPQSGGEEAGDAKQTVASLRLHVGEIIVGDILYRASGVAGQQAGEKSNDLFNRRLGSYASTNDPANFTALPGFDSAALISVAKTSPLINERCSRYATYDGVSKVADWSS
jgi:hypothetical protein